ncbi:hypothetical protein DNI29_23250 [Hymenobacter sediminis]|uniref:hypothetical protein n=1 Tax=Hymenobacter sediminis TaxID=2218621 RepID=UPI000DA6A052|nr:hypothetical protein [Hymenobacter sediminis]RPD43656.1 hypothetical protein DNI29_23250 [Hymenobacter sediminis]
MKKPLTPTPAATPSVSSNWKTGDWEALSVGTAAAMGPVIYQASTQQEVREVVRRALPQEPVAEPNYVDPYLFETGYYESRAEYEELMARPPSTIQLREDVENILKKKRISRSGK